VDVFRIVVLRWLLPNALGTSGDSVHILEAIVDRMESLQCSGHRSGAYCGYHNHQFGFLFHGEFVFISDSQTAHNVVGFYRKEIQTPFCISMTDRVHCVRHYLLGCIYSEVQIQNLGPANVTIPDIRPAGNSAGGSSAIH
jgi:hypothetical protein